MSIRDDITWFKQQFGERTEAVLAGTPFSLDLVVAIGTQESQEVWGRARASYTIDDVLRLCVGDIIDAPGRSAFPKSRAVLESVENGKEMFSIARQAFADMTTVAHEYKQYLRNPNKFVHAFGIFQYDIQVFRQDPDFFLQKQWYDYGKCLEKCLVELEEKRRVVFNSRTDLSRDDLVYVAIAYNKGSARVGAGFKQGFRSGGKYYGEMIDQYMRISSEV